MMQRVASLYRSSVGKKILMAVTGIVLFGFIVLHMAGNLKVLTGAESFDAYAEFIRAVGYPAIPHQGVLWTLRVVLLVCVFVHMVAAFQTWAQSRNARQVGYRKNDDLSFSYASRTMRWGGVIILLFLVYHILHFTTGQAHPDFVEGGVYHNFVVAFQNPAVLLVYLVAQAALCLHLYHGLWSVTQTLGANHPRYNRLRRPAAAAVALAIFIGFVTPPVLVLLGLIA
jgi:succinate dehydrogenase / fumarate reductase, cytochrome b subunit